MKQKIKYDIEKYSVKPKKPIEPQLKDYKTPTEPTGVNYLGQPIYEKLDWVSDYHKYQKAMEQYKKDMAIFEQIRMIRLIKNADISYILNNFKIEKNDSN